MSPLSEIAILCCILPGEEALPFRHDGTDPEPFCRFDAACAHFLPQVAVFDDPANAIRETVRISRIISG